MNVTLYEQDTKQLVEYDSDEVELVRFVSSLVSRMRVNASYCRVDNPQKFHIKITKDREGFFEVEIEDWRFNQYLVAEADTLTVEAILQSLAASRPIPSCVPIANWLVQGKIYPEETETRDSGL